MGVVAAVSKAGIGWVTKEAPVTQLRKMMLEELERRNYSQSTVRAYVKTIADLARYFKRPPDQLGPDQLRQYQAYLFRERKLAANTVNQRTAAQRNFFDRVASRKFLTICLMRILTFAPSRGAWRLHLCGPISAP